MRMHSIRRRALSLAPLIGAAGILAGCAVNPVTGHRELSLVTAGQELAIGREGHQAVLKEFGAYEDARLQAFVDSVGQALARRSHLPKLEWHFTVLDDPTVNAFAMPGGYIYVTRGILAHLNSEAQLAGVLGHEIGHVTARHSAQRVTQQQLAGLGLGLASAFVEGFSRYSQAAQTALGLMMLKYGRDDETQADQLGVDYALESGYDPREIPSTYTTLRRVGERSGQRLPGFLSTHPDPGDREVRTRELARQAVAGKTGLAIRQRSYVQRMDRVVFGNDPRHGYFEGSRFIHPELGFEMTFPSGWKTQNGREAVLAAEPGDAASMQLSLADPSELSPAGYVAELQRSGRIASARGASESVGGSAAWFGELLIARQDGTQGRLAAAFIRRSASAMFQVLGRSASAGDANEARILSSARSFRSVSDPALLTVRPDRVRVASVLLAGTFQEFFGREKALALGLDETSILNNLEPDEGVQKGQLIKLVEAGRR